MLGSPERLVEAATDHVMKRLDIAIARMPIKRLQTVLQPTYSWEHRDLPLATYITVAAMAAWSDT